MILIQKPDKYSIEKKKKNYKPLTHMSIDRKTFGVPVMAQWLMNPTGNHEVQAWPRSVG